MKDPVFEPWDDSFIWHELLHVRAHPGGGVPSGGGGGKPAGRRAKWVRGKYVFCCWMQLTLRGRIPGEWITPRGARPTGQLPSVSASDLEWE